MNFLYPSFLWGLLALSIPIIVHLFNFRRAKKIYFSNVSFLENVKESSSSKLKVKYLLVLLSRLLVVTFLVLAFAQPFLPGNEEGMDGTLVKVYLDNSQSASNLTASELNGLTEGISYLEEIINLYPNETDFQVITNDFGPSTINPKSKEKALEQATELDFSNLIRTKTEIINKIDPSENEVSQEDIYFISDFQKSSFMDSKPFPFDSTNKYKIVPIIYAAHDNVFVDSIFLESPFLISGEINKLHVKLKNMGGNDLTNVIIKFFVNNEQSASASIDIGQKSSNEIVFDLNFELAELNSCKVTFEDFPLTFDNEHYFTLNLLKKISISEIYGSDVSYRIGQLYSGNDLFKFNGFENGSVDYGLVQSSDLLVINQLSDIDKSIINIANDFLKKGKSVFIIPAAKPDSLAIQSILGKKVNRITKGVKLALDNPNLSNPFFENIFTELNSKSEMPLGSNVISWNSIGTDLLKLKNNLPFLTQIRKNGNLYLLASPLIDDYTNFHKHALFVPVLYRMAALSGTNYYPLNYTVDEPIITVKIDSIKNEQLFKLNRGVEEYIPQQRISGNNLILDIPKFLLSPGFYNLTYNGEIKNVLAFNYSKKESYPEQMTLDEIASTFSPLKNMEIIESSDASSFSQEMKERYQGIQLWKYALILALIFLLTETLFLRFL